LAQLRKGISEEEVLAREKRASLIFLTPSIWLRQNILKATAITLPNPRTMKPG
jgi:hypothetical protein